jgi:2-oxoglutarate dehydrogenase E2 component (dihydrolipoamide succinyltransferase)
MATRLLAPSFGEGVEELTVISWLKKEGETVKELEVIVELETDKVTTEIPSPVAGTLLKILAQKEDTVKVGSTLAWIGQPGEAIEAATPVEKTAVPVEAPKPAAVTPIPAAPEKTEYTGLVTPLVKQLAATNQVDLNLVHGTGDDGRITKEDVLNYLESKKTAPATAAPAVKSSSTMDLLPGRLIPHSSLRKQIAERMVNSMQTSPHVLTVMEADLSKVVAHRTTNKEVFNKQGVNLTLTAYFCSAIVSALKAFPEVNSAWMDDGLQIYSVINLGLATSLGEDGLIVPVIKDAGSLSLLELAQKINDLSTRARAKKLLPEEVKGGTFTLTNHGSGGSLFASPIIFQPQAAILGTGLVQKRPVVITDASGVESIAIRPMIYLSLVFDHRILDGEGSDRFLKKVKEVLENWS